MSGVTGQAREIRPERIAGAHGDAGSGPLLIVTGGLHGNEPAGLLAARRVFGWLEQHQPAMRGRVVALAGNLTALEHRQRYIEDDLNRVWSAQRVEQLRNESPSGDGIEQREQRELLEHIEAELDGFDGPAAFLDLHSTSAHGPPFSIMSDTLQNRRVAMALPLPVILGLEEAVEATLMEFMGERGYLCVGVEAGQHLDPQTVDNHESVLWLTLIALDMLDRHQVPDPDIHVRRLRHAARGLPRVVEILHRHGLGPDDDFAMENGYTNFTPVKADQLLATDCSGDLRAHRDGLLLLPSYQGQGDDGYFLGRKISVFWLKLSALLRRLRAERLLSLLPGVRRDLQRPGALLVDRRVARYLALQVFHLFGFRRRRPEGEQDVFSRRPEGRWR